MVVVTGRCRTVLLAPVFAAAFTTCGAPPGGPQVWFAPNLGSPDMIELFTRPQLWPGARRTVAAFKFYERALLADRPAECPECGRNIFPELARVDAFNRLNSWGIAIGIDVDAVKHWGCTAASTLPSAMDAVERVETRHAVVTYLSMDEPLLGGRDCDLELGEAAIHAASFARQARAAHPALRVGDIEPYPVFPVPTLLAWLTALRANSYTPAFFHLDVDRAHAARIGADVAGDLRTLRGAVEAQGIPFGVIFWSDVGTSDADYAADVLAWVGTVRAAIAEPTHSIFQSWVVSPDGSLRVPANLPEADAAVPTHTRLIDDGLSALRSAPPPGPR